MHLVRFTLESIFCINTSNEQHPGCEGNPRSPGFHIFSAYTHKNIFAENLAKEQFLCYHNYKSFRLELKGCAILPADFLGLQKAAKRPSALLCPNAGKCAPASLT